MLTASKKKSKEVEKPKVYRDFATNATDKESWCQISKRLFEEIKRVRAVDSSKNRSGSMHQFTDYNQFDVASNMSREETERMNKQKLVGYCLGTFRPSTPKAEKSKEVSATVTFDSMCIEIENYFKVCEDDYQTYYK